MMFTHIVSCHIDPKDKRRVKRVDVNLFSHDHSNIYWVYSGEQGAPSALTRAAST